MKGSLRREGAATRGRQGSGGGGALRGGGVVRRDGRDDWRSRLMAALLLLLRSVLERRRLLLLLVVVAAPLSPLLRLRGSCGCKHVSKPARDLAPLLSSALLRGPRPAEQSPLDPLRCGGCAAATPACCGWQRRQLLLRRLLLDGLHRPPTSRVSR